MSRTLLLVSVHLISTLAILATVFTDNVALTGPAYVGLQLAGVVANVAAARAADHGRARRTWWLLAAGFVVMIMSTVFFTAAGLITTGDGRMETHGGWLLAGIVTRFLFALILLGALLTLSHHRLDPGSRIRFVLDAATVLGGGFMVTWFFILAPVIQGARSVVVTLAWELAIIPFGDLALVIAMCAVLMRGSTPAARSPLVLLLLASIFWLGTDFLGTYTTLHPGTHPIPITLADVTQIVPLVFMVTAAAEQYRLHLGGHEGLAARRLRPVTWLPYLVLAAGFSLLMVAAAGDHAYPWFGLIGGASLMTFCVAARQFTVLRENRSLAMTDNLTGLANRARLHEVLDDLSRSAGPAGRQCAILLIDLDDFKPVNDTLGHEAGDAVLFGFAQILRNRVRASDTPARLGGDEFAVILMNIRTPDDAVHVAERILHDLETPFYIAGHPVSVRASIGIALQGATSNGDDLMRSADLAMYEAKRRRTHGWHMFASGVSDAVHEQGRLRDELRLAVDSGQLRVVYQPIIDLASRQITSFEALVRWQHPRRGLLAPDAFLPLAEETGLIHDIDLCVLREACLQMKNWTPQTPDGHGWRLNANLSAGQLKRPDLATLVLDVLSETGFPPDRLVLEITETSAPSINEALTHVTMLRERGVKIALDDFGTGHWALEHLTRMPVDIIKLDRCFVAEFAHERASQAIAKTVVRLALLLQLDTVAEGIETAEQAQQMMDLGYVGGQGYWFAPPLAASDVPPFLAVNSRSANLAGPQHQSL